MILYFNIVLSNTVILCFFFFRSWTVLLPLLHDLFPFLGKPAYLQECYIRNLLQMTSYLPNARQKILELVTDRMLKLDVSNQNSLIIAFCNLPFWRGRFTFKQKISEFDQYSIMLTHINGLDNRHGLVSRLLRISFDDVHIYLNSSILIVITHIKLH